MASGFAKPTLGLIALLSVAFIAPTRTHTIAWIAFVTLLFGLGEWHCRFRARRQTQSWCRQQGFSEPRWSPRSGFVTWGWSLWSFCEMLPCEFDDHNGTTQHTIVDLRAPMFGFWVQSCVLSNVNQRFAPHTKENDEPCDEPKSRN